MKVFSRLWMRYRYPVTLPHDIAHALGVSLPQRISFEDFFYTLTNPSLFPTTLKRWMPRSMAESQFFSAQRKERFGENTIFSYYFNEGWLIFVLRFDKEGRLRGINLRHERITHERGLEIPLK